MSKAVLKTPGVELKRQIGLFAATAITVGNIVGSGIFGSPNSIAQELSGLGIVIVAWVVGGILSMCGSLVLAELAVAHPRTGGLYVFIREAFGDAWAFVFGWANIWVMKPTVIASITYVFATYFRQAVGLPDGAHVWVGIAAIVLITAINWLGVREGARTAVLFTTAKMIGILALVIAAFAIPHTQPAASASLTGPNDNPIMLAFVFAMISVLFAYDGWTDATFVGGEVKNPSRNLPIAIIGGTVVVIITYVLTNLAYYAVMSPADVAAHEAVASETIGRLVGDWGRAALAVLVAISTFGTTNGAILTGPRVTLAMAADGLLWKPLAAVDLKRGSPGPALWLQCILACTWFAVAEGFDDISGWFVTTAWLFYGVSIAAIFVQRRRERQGKVEATSYRTPLYPLTPIVFILVTVVLIVSDLNESGIQAAAGVIISATGFPVYYLWKARRRREAQ